MKKILTSILLIIILTTGCSYRELNDLAIANSIGIDYVDNQYIVTVQVLNLKKESEENEQEKAVIYKATGETLATAFRNISLGYPKTLYLGHLELVILGQSMLDKDLRETFDYFLRSPEARNEFDVLFNPTGSANEILEPAKEKANSFPSKEIISTIENSMNRQGTTVKMNMEQFLALELEKGIDPVCTTIETIDDEPKLTGIIALNNNHSNFKLSKKQAIAYNIFNENFYDIIVKLTYKDELMDFAIVKPTVDIKMDFKKELNIDIKVKLSSQISEVRQKINLEDTKIQKELEKK